MTTNRSCVLSSNLHTCQITNWEMERRKRKMQFSFSWIWSCRCWLLDGSLLSRHTLSCQRLQLDRPGRRTSGYRIYIQYKSNLKIEYGSASVLFRKSSPNGRICRGLCVAHATLNLTLNCVYHDAFLWLFFRVHQPIHLKNDWQTMIIMCASSDEEFAGVRGRGDLDNAVLYFKFFFFC